MRSSLHTSGDLPTGQFRNWSRIGFVVAAGIALRCVQAFQDRALWLDEAMLALNIRRLSFFELCGPLQYDQAAPVGFLWLQKLTSLVVPDPELSARIVPWAAGCTALVVFAMLMMKVAGRKSLLAVTVMALSPTLICFSGEGKQYSLDVLCGVAALWVGLRWIEAPNRRTASLGGLFSAMVPWFSHTGIFFLPGVVVLAIVFRDRSGWTVTITCTVAVCLSVLTLYMVNIRQVHGNPALNNFWQSDYVPWHAIERLPTEFEAVAVWSIRKWWELIGRSTGLAPAVPRATVAWFAVAGVTIVITWMLWRVVREVSASALLVGYSVLPVTACLVASAAQIYPFGNRLLLFSAPLVIFLLGHFPLTTAWKWMGRCQLDVLVSAFVLTAPFVSACETVGEWKSVENMFAPHYPEDIRPFVAQMLNAEQTQTGCYVFHAARPAFEYYSGDHTQNVSFGSPGDLDHYRNEVKTCLAEKSKWYFLYAHTAPWGILEPQLAYDHLTALQADQVAPVRDDVRFFSISGRQPDSNSGSGTAEKIPVIAPSSFRSPVVRPDQQFYEEP